MFMLPHLEQSRINLELTDDASFLENASWTLSAHNENDKLEKKEEKRQQHQQKDTTTLQAYDQFYLQLV